MKNRQSRELITMPAAALVLLAGTSFAGTPEATTSVVATPDWLTVSGYAAASYIFQDGEGVGSSDALFESSTPFDAVKLGLQAVQGPVSAYVSLFYAPVPGNSAFGAGGDAGILDAYVTYKTGNFSITGGEYVSWLGFESFDAVNMYQMSYANAGLGAIPGYHSGVKVEYITDVIGTGVNLSDSITPRVGGFWEGDGDFTNGLGYEAYFTYKGIDKLTLWTGAAFEEADGQDDFVTYDAWASYDLSDKMTVAAEIAYSDSGNVQGFQGLVFMKYAFTEKFFTVFRVGFDDYDSVEDTELGVETFARQNFRYTIAPSYAFNEHFTLRAEASYVDIDRTDNVFLGVQALLAF